MTACDDASCDAVVADFTGASPSSATAVCTHGNCRPTIEIERSRPSIAETARYQK